MTNIENTSKQSIQNEITRLTAENAAIAVKVAAVSAVGSLAGLYYASKQNKSGWGKVGYFFAGGAIARLPLLFYYTSTLAQNLARIEQLQRQLDVQ